MDCALSIFTDEPKEKKKKVKPLYIKDQIRQELLSKGAEAGLSDEDDSAPKEYLPTTKLRYQAPSLLNEILTSHLKNIRSIMVSCLCLFFLLVVMMKSKESFARNFLNR